MNMIITSILVAIVISVGAAFVMQSGVQRPSYEAFTTSGARVGEPGNNLVGPTWSGNQS